MSDTHAEKERKLLHISLAINNVACELHEYLGDDKCSEYRAWDYLNAASSALYKARQLLLEKVLEK